MRFGQAIRTTTLLLAAGAFSAACSKPAPAPPENGSTAADAKVEYLLVQTARSFRFADSTLVLESVGPMTLYFSDRPERITGWLTTREQTESWGVGEDNFAENPPNAALSILEGDSVQEVVVVLRHPRLAGSELSYDVTILEGDLPAAGPESALFIDIVGAPMTPVSVAGVARRTTRRMVRRY